jgi:hypothetical protein
MKRMRLITTLIAALILAAGLSTVAAAQIAPADASALTDASMKALLDIAASNPRDRNGARILLTRQIGSFNSAARNSATEALLIRVRGDATLGRNDALAILGQMQTPWTTGNLESDIQFLYQQLQVATDDVSKDLFDNALANAKGLYKDGIASFNSTNLADLVSADAKLRVMSVRYPRSRFGERAAFYYAQLYAKRFVLGDTAGAPLLQMSNVAFEDYIKRAEKGEFDRTNYLAAGYYYRALNDWLANDFKNTQEWLKRGQKFKADTDAVYIYQLFVSREKDTVIDKYVPAKIAFEKTQEFVSRTPSPAFNQISDLVTVLRQPN